MQFCESRNFTFKNDLNFPFSEFKVYNEVLKSILFANVVELCYSFSFNAFKLFL